jgi:hypothetical protein
MVLGYPEISRMSIEEVQRKLDLAQQNADYYRKLAALPSLSHRAALAAHNRVRSHLAAASLYRKALAHEHEKAARP